MKDHESCVRYWFDHLELTRPDKEAEETMFWEPIVNEVVVLSTHPHSGVPETFQGKLGTIVDVNDAGNLYGFYCCLTDQYVRSDMWFKLPARTMLRQTTQK